MLSIHSSVTAHLGCFHFFTIINYTVKDIHLQDFVWTYVFTSFGEIPRRIAESYGNFMFNFLKKFCLAKCLYHFTISLAVNEGSSSLHPY